MNLNWPGRAVKGNRQKVPPGAALAARSIGREISPSTRAFWGYAETFDWRADRTDYLPPPAERLSGTMDTERPPPFGEPTDADAGAHLQALGRDIFAGPEPTKVGGPQLPTKPRSAPIPRPVDRPALPRSPQVTPSTPNVRTAPRVVSGPHAVSEPTSVGIAPVAAVATLTRTCTSCNEMYPADFLVCPRDATPLVDTATGDAPDPMLGKLLSATPTASRGWSARAGWGASTRRVTSG